MVNEFHFLWVQIAIGIFLVFLISVYIVSAVNFFKVENRYRENLPLYRKTLYFLFTVLIGVLGMLNQIRIEDWKYLLMAAIAVVFTDIAVLSTPTITKIWNAEFGSHDDAKKYIQQNATNERNRKAKLNYFSQLVQTAHFVKGKIAEQGLNEREAFQTFLNYYPNEFGLKMVLYRMGIRSEHEEQISEEFRALITRIERVHSLNLEEMADIPKEDNRDSRSARERAIQQVWNGTVLALNKEEENIAHICPIFIRGKDSYVIFLIEDTGTLLELDPLLITDLAYIYLGIAD